MQERSPIDAADPARDEAALPVDAHATIRLPAAYARVVAIADALSFMELWDYPFVFHE